MDDNKHKIWSEGRGARSTAEDVLEGLDFEHLDAIKEQSTKNGILYTGNCMHCGRQWKMVTKWVELASWFVGQPVPETVPTRQGRAAAAAARRPPAKHASTRTLSCLSARSRRCASATQTLRRVSGGALS